MKYIWYVSVCFSFYFNWCSNFPIFDNGSHFKLALGLFWPQLHNLWCFFLACQNVPDLYRNESSHSLRSPGSFKCEMVYKDYTVNNRSVYCYWFGHCFKYFSEWCIFLKIICIMSWFCYFHEFQSKDNKIFTWILSSILPLSHSRNYSSQW